MAKRSDYCRKEGEISEMHTDLQMLKKFMMGNGNEGLVVTVPRLTDAVSDLEVVVKNLDRNVGKVVDAQSHYEGEKAGKEEIRKRNRWIIGILAGALGTTIGLLITLILSMA